MQPGRTGDMTDFSFRFCSMSVVGKTKEQHRSLRKHLIYGFSHLLLVGCPSVVKASLGDSQSLTGRESCHIVL